MSKSNNLTIVIQAGGESRRMGRSKATVPFLGEPLLLRGINRLEALADELLVTTNEPENLGFLSEKVDAGEIKLVTDVFEQRGALRGVCTAVEAASNEYVALVACDMVFPSPNLISAELSTLVESGADAAVPCTSHGYEPFHGVYRKSTCLPLIRAYAEKGEARAAGWFDDANIICFDSRMVHDAEPRGGCFINVNTPDELSEMEEKIRAGEMRERESFDN